MHGLTVQTSDGSASPPQLPRIARLTPVAGPTRLVLTSPAIPSVWQTLKTRVVPKQKWPRLAAICLDLLFPDMPERDYGRLLSPLYMPSEFVGLIERQPIPRGIPLRAKQKDVHASVTLCQRPDCTAFCTPRLAPRRYPRLNCLMTCSVTIS